MTSERNIKQGAQNLLFNCAKLKPSEALLIVCEDPALGWYDAAAPKAIAQAAREIGVNPTIVKVGKPENFANPEVDAAVSAHDCTVYFARMGDQDRFGSLASGTRGVMSYVRDIEMLASVYSRATYAAFVAIKEAVNEVLLTAEHIKITCPLGTNFTGRGTETKSKKNADVSVSRFPLGVPQPMDASGFSGQVALTHFLTPTGSKCYQPASVKLEHTTLVEIKNGRIIGHSGDLHQINMIEQHYNRVAKKFGIERDIVHSWHAGIHPASYYRAEAADNSDRWSNSAFTNPRLLHFHTCGNYAPAEICWMVLDHTICVDGKNLWNKGRLDLDCFPQTGDCIEQWPELSALFEHPSAEIGLPPY